MALCARVMHKAQDPLSRGWDKEQLPLPPRTDAGSGQREPSQVSPDEPVAAKQVLVAGVCCFLDVIGI